MKKALLSIVACLGAAAVVLITGRLANPDSAKVIPYPEVINLKRVPTFDDKGIVPQQIVKKVSPQKIVANKPSRQSPTQKIVASQPSKQSPTKKIGELLLEHQKLKEIRLVGASPRSLTPAID